MNIETRQGTDADEDQGQLKEDDVDIRSQQRELLSGRIQDRFQLMTRVMSRPVNQIGSVQL